MSSKFYLGVAGLAALVLVVVGSGFSLSAISTGATSNVLSYCGTPNYFDQFEEQYGYSPISQCTSVEVEGYRIDVSKSSYLKDWGCTADYTVYRIQSNGDLEKVADPAATQDSMDIELDGLTVDGLTANSGLSFYNCDWIQTNYEVELPGQLSFESDVPVSVERGDKVDVKVDASNEYREGMVEGDLSVEICGVGAFDERQCTTRTRSISLGPGRSNSYTFTVDTSRVGSELSASTSFDGDLTGVIDDWKAVNLDCDGDNVIEPVSQCSGLNLEGSGGSVSVDVREPGIGSRVESLVTSVWNEVYTLWLNVAGKPVPTTGGQ